MVWLLFAVARGSQNQGNMDNGHRYTHCWVFPSSSMRTMLPTRKCCITERWWWWGVGGWHLLHSLQSHCHFPWLGPFNGFSHLYVWGDVICSRLTGATWAANWWSDCTCANIPVFFPARITWMHPSLSLIVSKPLRLIFSPNTAVLLFSSGWFSSALVLL